MKRRNFIQWSSLLGFAGLFPAKNAVANQVDIFEKQDRSKQSDRAYWVAVLDKIASPVLSNMSKGELRKNMRVEYSPTWDGRNNQVAYMEAFGRLIAGLTPFLALPDDETAESKVRERLRLQTLQSLAHAVNPNSPDYLYWGNNQVRQPLVDASYIAQAFLMEPDTLWKPLDSETKLRFIH